MQLILLSDKFYNLYGACPEILTKKTRPYACLQVQIDNVTYAIPFRHHIAHKYAFITYNNCGLDYTKAVVVHDPQFIDSKHPQIEQREFNALKGKDARIVQGMRKYVALYKKARSYSSSTFYSNILKYSTLQYFDSYI